MSTVEQTVEKLQQTFGIVSTRSTVCRLSGATRRLAARALAGEFGRTMRAAPFRVEVNLDAEPRPNRRYAEVVSRLAAEAPLRIDPDELVVGSATLLEAADHQTPGCNIRSTSHTTIGFDRVLAEGYAGIRKQIEERLNRGDLDDKGRDLLEAMRACLDAAALWHRRHIDELNRLIDASRGTRKDHYRAVLHSLEHVPEHPARTFREGLQALWFAYAFQRLCGNWSGLGRIDLMLGGLLDKDLADGTLVLDEARELLAHFLIKGCEWTGAPTRHVGTSGDAQFYQNIVLGGVDDDGAELLNDATWLVLDVIEELHISDWPVAVRVTPKAPRRLLRRIAEVQRLGGGIVSVYNDRVVRAALERFGYAPQESRRYSNDGCWETIVPGATAFGYCPFDTLQLLQEVLGIGGDEAVDFADFESLYAAFVDRLRRAVVEDILPAFDNQYDTGHPAPLLSILVDDCIERARGYYDMGARYSVKAVHPGGLPDVVDNLLAIRRLVYDQKRMSLPELVDILKADWAGRDTLRREMLSRDDYYGNDCDEADALMVRLFDNFTSTCDGVRQRAGVLRPAGISTFGREIGWRQERAATAFGRHAGSILATNLSPSPGTDRGGPTAVIRSFCKMDFTKLPGGVPLELKLHPSGLEGEAGLEALTSLIETFVNLGGYYLHVDAVSAEILRDAQRHPENYPNLCVRISGWSARFATLDKQWQDMIIQRTEQTV